MSNLTEFLDMARVSSAEETKALYKRCARIDQTLLIMKRSAWLIGRISSIWNEKQLSDVAL